MARRELVSITTLVLDESRSLTLGELCRLCDVSAEYVLALVEEGLLDPVGTGPSEWRFTAAAVPRIRLAVRLQEEMEVNLPGVALTLDLLDEVRDLRARVRAMERLLGPGA